jgi:hypothetical protein
MALINCPECNKQISDKAEICVGCGAPVEVNLKFIIGIPITFGNLEVAQYDFPDIMTWYDAKIDCAKLGNGWRLPIKDELNILYKNKDKIRGFAGGSYWSSTEYDGNFAWNQGFVGGFQDYYYKIDTYYVCAIRTF